MRERIAELMQRLADAAEVPPCRDFDELVARVLPVINASRDVALLDVESERDPPRILVASGNGWLVFIDLDGLRAYKTESGAPSIPDERTTPAAVRRRFVRVEPGAKPGGQRETG
jgi:hypothetical protein